MRSGTTSLDLELTLRFSADGALSGLHSIATSGGIELPRELSRQLYLWLSERKQFEALQDECWANSEPEVDECDDERFPGAAE